MFEENEILTQIRALRQEVGSRLDDMDLRLSKIEAELSAPALQSVGARLEEMEERLHKVESELTGTPAPVINASAPLNPTERQIELAPAPVPTTAVEVTVRPLDDVSLVRVVEGALMGIVGVEAVSLQTLSGDTAELRVDVQEDVSLIGGLRRTLPLAFDVSESSDSSFTIALALPLTVQPEQQRQGDAVVHKAKAQ